MATQTWIPPLPAGWEGRWDPTQRAYFFINHNDKRTSWEDPRFGQQAHHPAPTPHHPAPTQHHPAPTQHHSNAGHHATAHGHSGGSSVAAAAQALSQHGQQQQRSKGEAIPLETRHTQHKDRIVKGAYNPEAEESSESEWENDEDFDALFSSSQADWEKVQKIKQMYPYAPEEAIRDALGRHGNDLAKACMEVTKAGYKNYELKQPANQDAAFNRLKAMYPTADANLIKDVLAQVQNDESRARIQLEDIGYKPTSHYTATPRRSPTPSPRPGTRQEQQRQPSPAKAATPKRTSPPKISESEKNRLATKLKSEFPSQDKAIIEMALESAGYQEGKARELLQRWATVSASRAKSPSSQASHKDHTAPKTSSSATHSLEPVALKASRDNEPAAFSTTAHEPVTFKDDDSFTSRPSTSSTTQAASNRSTPARTTPTRGSPHRSVSPSTPASHTSARSTPDRTAGQTSTQQHRAKQVTHTTRQAIPRKPVVSQPTSASGYRTLAQGPNPALRQGPDRKLLLTEYTLAKGPNPEFRSGPDRTRVQGSQGAFGPDRSLRCGPQDDLWKGSNPNMLLAQAAFV